MKNAAATNQGRSRRLALSIVIATCATCSIVVTVAGYLHPAA